jgi:hypothetical protein
MKAALFLVFLALGPALADQLPVVPTFYAAAATAPVGRTVGIDPANRVSRAEAALSADERARFCGRGS